MLPITNECPTLICFSQVVSNVFSVIWNSFHFLLQWGRVITQRGANYIDMSIQCIVRTPTHMHINTHTYKTHACMHCYEIHKTKFYFVPVISINLWICVCVIVAMIQWIRHNTKWSLNINNFNGNKWCILRSVIYTI